MLFEDDPVPGALGLVLKNPHKILLAAVIPENCVVHTALHLAELLCVTHCQIGFYDFDLDAILFNRTGVAGLFYKHLRH